MNDARNVWETYASAWKAEDAAAKKAALARTVAEGAVYRDPLAECRGHEALTDYMVAFHQQVPGGHFRTTWFLAHHDRSIARWDMVDGQGHKIGEGVSYGEYAANGMLVAMTGFFDLPAAA